MKFDPKKLKDIRKRFNQSQKQMCKIIGCKHNSSWSRKEQGQESISTKQLQAICDKFKIGWEELFVFDGSEDIPKIHRKNLPLTGDIGSIITSKYPTLKDCIDSARTGYNNDVSEITVVLTIYEILKKKIEILESKDKKDKSIPAFLL